MPKPFISVFLPAFLLLVHGLPLLAQDTVVDVQKDDVPFIQLPILNGTPVRIDPDTGNLTLQTTDQFECGVSCDNVSVSVADGNGFFLVNGNSPAEATEGSTVRMTWDSRGAWECSGSGLPGTTWNGTGKAPRGSQDVSLAAFAADTLQTAVLSCSNGPETDSRSVEISIIRGNLDIPEACRGRQPADMTPMQFCEVGESTDCFRYADLFGVFPGINNSKEVLTDRDTYLAIGFNSGDMINQASGAWNFSALPISVVGASGPRIMSISPCPGDFDSALVASDMNSQFCYVKTSGFTTSVQWKRAGTSGSSCPLDPNTDYYLNILYTTDPAETQPSDLQWSCNDDPNIDACGHLVAPK